MQVAKLVVLLASFVCLTGESQSSITAQALDLRTAENELSRCIDPDRGARCLQEIAALYNMDSPDAGVVSIVEGALGHPLLRVRCEAAMVMGLRFAPDESLPVLITTLEAVEAEGVGLAERLTEIDRTLKGGSNGQAVGLFGRIAKLKKAAREAAEFERALLKALMQRPDDRSASAVAARLPVYLHDDACTAFVDYLLECGTQPSIGAVVQACEAVDELAAKKAQERKQLTRVKAPKRPKDHRGSASEWRAHVKAEKAATLLRFDQEVEVLMATATALHRRVREFAYEKRLARVPKQGALAQWGSWWKRHREAFPATVANGRSLPGS